MLLQAASVVGALLVLGAYALIQSGRVGARTPSYNWMNLVGALLLLWVALTDRRWGFILLEATWAAIALPPLVRGWLGGGKGEAGTG